MTNQLFYDSTHIAFPRLEVLMLNPSAATSAETNHLKTCRRCRRDRDAFAALALRRIMSPDNAWEDQLDCALAGGPAPLLDLVRSSSPPRAIREEAIEALTEYALDKDNSDAKGGNWIRTRACAALRGACLLSDITHSDAVIVPDPDAAGLREHAVKALKNVRSEWRTNKYVPELPPSDFLKSAKEDEILKRSLNLLTFLSVYSLGNIQRILEGLENPRVFDALNLLDRWTSHMVDIGTLHAEAQLTAPDGLVYQFDKTNLSLTVIKKNPALASIIYQLRLLEGSECMKAGWSPSKDLQFGASKGLPESQITPLKTEHPTWLLPPMIVASSLRDCVYPESSPAVIHFGKSRFEVSCVANKWKIDLKCSPDEFPSGRDFEAVIQFSWQGEVKVKLKNWGFDDSFTGYHEMKRHTDSVIVVQAKDARTILLRELETPAQPLESPEAVWEKLKE